MTYNGNVTGGDWNPPGLNPDSGDITGGTLNFNSSGQISSSLAIDASGVVIVNRDYNGGSMAITGDGRITGQVQT